MKKFAVGCLVVLVLGAVALTVGGYFLYRAASPMIQDARNSLEAMRELGEIDRQIQNRATYEPPASRELTENQVQRFARVQDHVRTALGQRFEEIDKKYNELRKTSGSEQPTIGEMLAALKDLGSVFVETRRFQVAALNQEGFSQSEYTWVRARIYEAAGIEMVTNVDLQKIEEAIRQGGIDTSIPELPSSNVPEKNRVLVKPYMARMDEWLPLAFFGL